MGRHHNPPHIGRIQLAYLRQYAHDTAYIGPPARTEATKRRIYDTLPAGGCRNPRTVIRIVQKRPDVHWDLVWQNLHDSPAPEEVRSAWYAVIHDILPTRERLAAINLADTVNCRQCSAKDTVTDSRNVGRVPPSGTGQSAGLL